MTPRLVRGLAAATPLVAAVVFAHAVCGALFSCGCVAFSMAQCSIHHPTVDLPPCPWCTGRVLFPLALALWIAGAAFSAWLTRRHNFATTFAASLAAVLFAILLSGALTVAITGYPTLLGMQGPG